METSDSEYFESADEDFTSDNETQIDEEKKDLKWSEKNTDDKLTEKTAKLSVNQDSSCKIKKKHENVESDKCDKTEEKIAQQKDEIESRETNICEKPQSVKDNLTKTECWEPGVDYENIEKTPSSEKEQPKRPEFGSPPTIAIGGCWFPNNQNRKIPDKPPIQVPPAVSKTDEENKSSNKGAKPKRPEFGIPPARTTCWIPGVTNPSNIRPSDPHPAYLELMKKKEEEKKQLQKQTDVSDEGAKPKRPEFGIPPARTTCWIPGVTNPSNIQPSEPHPAYLELMKKKEEEKKQLQKETDAKQVHVEESNDQTEENMWSNDEDWGDFDISTTHDSKPHVSSEDTNEKNVNTIPKKEMGKSTTDKNKDNAENMWEDDDWESLETNQEKELPQQTKEESTSSWGGWGNWGLSTVLSTATNLTSQVSQGLSTVLETGIGAPDPEELARITKMEREKIKENHPNEEIPEEKPILSFGLGNLMQGVTKLVETTGTKVIHGGLDTLETIGKKTMEVLQENDPGLKKKRAFLKLDDDKPILSQVLREAKEKAERENKELEKKHFAKKANYETLFDDHQGLVHLEALEMLSKQCDIKLQNQLESCTGSVLSDMQETLDQVKELCELPEEEDEDCLSMEEIKEKLETAISEININITYKKLLSTWEEIEEWLLKVNLNICNKNELHQQAIESLAQLTALAVEQFHKAGELLLVKDHRSTVDEADSLVQLTITLTTLIGIVAAKFSEKLNTIAAESTEKEEINSLITNVFFEAANSSSYIQDAFQLLIPVLQVGAV